MTLIIGEEFIINTMDIKIIHLPLERWSKYKDLRLEAIKSAPTAFLASVEEYSDKDDTYWQEKLKGYQGIDGLIFFAENNGKLVGMLGVDFNHRIKKRHAVTFGGVYVKEKFRGHGIGGLLIGAALDEIKDKKDIVKIDLDVNTENKSAIALYQRFGFEIVGKYQKELYVDGKYYDFYEMERILK